MTPYNCRVPGQQHPILFVPEVQTLQPSVDSRNSMRVKESSVCRVCVPILLTPEVFPKALGVFSDVVLCLSSRPLTSDLRSREKQATRNSWARVRLLDLPTQWAMSASSALPWGWRSGSLLLLSFPEAGPQPPYTQKSSDNLLPCWASVSMEVIWGLAWSPQNVCASADSSLI